MVHVKVSNSETWDYPPEWGLERIKEDLKRRLAAEDEADRRWAASLPPARKAECDSLAKDTPMSDQPDDCNRLFWIGFGFARAMPTGWESQLEPQTPFSAAVERALALGFGPPVLALVLGATFGWVLAGFRERGDTDR